MAVFIAACFDLDGTLIDTEPIHISAENECLETFGIDLKASHRPRTFGMGIESGMKTLAELFELEFTTVLKTYVPLWEKGLQSNLKVLPGVSAVLSWLSDHDIPLALVTSGDSVYVDLVDSVLNLKQEFGAIVTSESVQRLKPDPAPYLEAARRLGVDPRGCIGFEDSGSGVMALNSAMMFSVAVHPAHESRPELHKAGMRVETLDAVEPYLASWFE